MESDSSSTARGVPWIRARRGRNAPRCASGRSPTGTVLKRERVDEEQMEMPKRSAEDQSTSVSPEKIQLEWTSDSPGSSGADDILEEIGEEPPTKRIQLESDHFDFTSQSGRPSRESEESPEIIFDTRSSEEPQSGTSQHSGKHEESPAEYDTVEDNSSDVLQEEEEREDLENDEYDVEDERFAEYLSLPAEELDDEEDQAEEDCEGENIPEKTTFFMECCSAANISEKTASTAWRIYHAMKEKIAADGSEISWQLAAVYYTLISTRLEANSENKSFLMRKLPLPVNLIANNFDVSVVEMLEKTIRLTEMISPANMKQYLDYLQKVQERLAVTCVIFKKFCAVFQEVFANPSQRFLYIYPSSQKLFGIIWTSFLIMRSRLEVDDLLTNYKLMFSMFDEIYTSMCEEREAIAPLLNPDFVRYLLVNDSSILRALCEKFGGTVLDTRYFYENIYKKLNRRGIPLKWNFNFYETVIRNQTALYDDYLLKHGNVDERVLIPNPLLLENMFMSKTSYRVINIWKLSKKNQDIKNAEELNKITTNRCIEKFYKTPKTSYEFYQPPVNSKTITEYSLKLGTYPEDINSDDTHRRLMKIIGKWTLENSRLKEICKRMTEDPMPVILSKCNELGEKFERTISSECKDLTEDSPIRNYHNSVRKSVEKIFLLFIEKIIMAEMRKYIRDEDLLSVLRRNEFLESVFCFSIELAFVSYDLVQEKPFPWSAEICNCHPLIFHKIIDVLINIEQLLSRRMVNHFNRIVEEIVEIYAWKNDSPIWETIVRSPLKYFQEFGQDVNDLTGSSPIKLTPLNENRPLVPNSQTSKTLRIFMKRVYFISATVLQDLADRISMSSRYKSQCWSLFDHLLCNQPLVFMDRCLDQILLCCAFVIMRVNGSQISFNEIMAHYRKQQRNVNVFFVYHNVPIFTDHIEGTKSVNIAETIEDRLKAPDRDTMTVDLIQFFNKEFRDRVKKILTRIKHAPNEDLTEMPVPTAKGLVPVKIQLAEKFTLHMVPKTTSVDSREDQHR